MNMTNNIIDEIENFYAQCSLIDKAANVAYLHGQWQKLDNLAYQLGLYFQSKGYVTPAERRLALQLIDDINTVKKDGSKAKHELANEAMKKLWKIGKNKFLISYQCQANKGT